MEAIGATEVNVSPEFGSTEHKSPLYKSLWLCDQKLLIIYLKTRLKITATRCMVILTPNTTNLFFSCSLPGPTGIAYRAPSGQLARQWTTDKKERQKNGTEKGGESCEANKHAPSFENTLPPLQHTILNPIKYKPSQLTVLNHQPSSKRVHIMYI